jgi:hypothetical protein
MQPITYWVLLLGLQTPVIEGPTNFVGVSVKVDIITPADSRIALQRFGVTPAGLPSGDPYIITLTNNTDHAVGANNRTLKFSRLRQKLRTNCL